MRTTNIIWQTNKEWDQGTEVNSFFSGNFSIYSNFFFFKLLKHCLSSTNRINKIVVAAGFLFFECFNFFGSVSQQRGMMGTDLRTAGLLEDHAVCTETKTILTTDTITITASSVVSLFLFNPTIAEELPLFCFFIQMGTICLGLCCFCWWSCPSAEHFVKLEDGVSEKVVLFNRLLSGLYGALTGCRGGQGEELPSCRGNRTL